MLKNIKVLQDTLQQTLMTLGLSQGQIDAEIRLTFQHLLNTSPSQRLAHPEKLVTKQEWETVQHYLKQRVTNRTPIQYIFEQAYFYGLRFKVTPDVLIPRPETELLVETVLKKATPGMRILDIGTGSGAIAIALSHHLGESVTLVATDISARALEVAKDNQAQLKTLVQFQPPGSLFEPVTQESPFDIIVSNPPYIAPALKPSLSPEVLQHEPHSALFPPSENEYYFYQEIGQAALSQLCSKGFLMVETGALMGKTVARHFETLGYCNIAILCDYAGLDRIVTAQKP